MLGRRIQIGAPRFGCGRRLPAFFERQSRAPLGRLRSRRRSRALANNRATASGQLCPDAGSRTATGSVMTGRSGEFGSFTGGARRGRRIQGGAILVAGAVGVRGAPAPDHAGGSLSAPRHRATQLERAAPPSHPAAGAARAGPTRSSRRAVGASSRHLRSLLLPRSWTGYRGSVALAGLGDERTLGAAGPGGPRARGE